MVKNVAICLPSNPAHHYATFSSPHAVCACMAPYASSWSPVSRGTGVTQWGCPGRRGFPQHPSPMGCSSHAHAGRGEPIAPPHWLLSLRTAQGQREIQTLVYFRRVTVDPPPQLSQSSLPPEAPSLQAGEGSTQGNKIPICTSSSCP